MSGVLPPERYQGQVVTGLGKRAQRRHLERPTSSARLLALIFEFTLRRVRRWVAIQVVISCATTCVLTAAVLAVG
ncbi:MAG: hypothetical protein F4Y14_05875 [Acidobacteria bacterium]|nr:hypothetical protein [Acidobacteriota bacterium]